MHISYYRFTARVRASMRAIPADTCPNGAAVRACIRAGIARIQASKRCSKACIACFANDSSSVYTKQTAALCMHRHSTNIAVCLHLKTFLLGLQREEVRCDYDLIFLLNFLVSKECVVGGNM